MTQVNISAIKPTAALCQVNISKLILDLGITWKRLSCLTIQPFYPVEKGPRYLLDRELSGFRRRLDIFVKINILPLPRIESRYTSHYPVTVFPPLQEHGV